MPAYYVAKAGSKLRVPWLFEAQERGDVFHRVRVFPPAVRDWRERLAGLAMESSRGLDREEARVQVDEGITRLREIERVLGLTRGATRKRAPVEGIRRVLDRLRPFRELESLGVPAPKELPPLLEVPLSMSLGVHAAEVCTPIPNCGSCEIKKACAHFRGESAKKALLDRESPTAIDLFAGAGGLSEGFRRAGFSQIAASDFDAMAAKTYRLNHPEVPDAAVLVRDVRELKASELKKLMGGRRLDVLAGAPPCQGFSSVGLRSKKTLTGYVTKSDQRNFLFESLVGLALELKPPLFLMENVPGMESALKEDLSFIDTAARMLQQGGYKTAVWKLYASAHGVPQERIRCFLVGARGVPLPTPPLEEYQNTRRSDYDPDALPKIKLDEAIFDLSRSRVGHRLRG